MNQSADATLRLTREIDAPVEEVWELWTTPTGIEAWWAPDGFVVSVSQLELEVGGPLLYTMTATDPAQVQFMRDAGMPLATEARKTFTEVQPPSRLAYSSLVDYVPDAEPYEQLTWIQLEPAGEGTAVTMTMQPLHDEVWTERLVAGRENELANLAAEVKRRRTG